MNLPEEDPAAQDSGSRCTGGTLVVSPLQPPASTLPLQALIQSRLLQPAADARLAAAAPAVPVPPAGGSIPCTASKQEAAALSSPQPAPQSAGARPRSGQAAVATAAAAAAAQAAAQASPSQAEVYTLALKRALALPQYTAGFVVDGVASQLLPATDAARALLQAAGLELKPPPLVPVLSLGGKGKALAGAGTAGARKLSAVGKGAAASESPREPAKPDEWLGAQHVHVVELQLSKQEAFARLQLPADTFSMAAACPGASPPCRASAPETTSSVPAAALANDCAAGSDEAGRPREQPQQQQQQAETLGPRWLAAEADATALAPVLGALQPAGAAVQYRSVVATGSEFEVHAAAVGIAFYLGKVSTVLPPVAADALLVPPPYVLRVLKRPKERRDRGAPAHFRLWTAPAGDIGEAGDADNRACGAGMGLECPSADAQATAKQQSAALAIASDGSAAAGAPAGAAASVPQQKSVTGSTPRKSKKGDEAAAAAVAAAVAAPEAVSPSEEK